MTRKRRDETCCKTLCWTPHTTHSPERDRQTERRSFLGSDRLEPSNSSLRVLRSPCPPSAVGGRFGLVERGREDGKEREGRAKSRSECWTERHQERDRGKQEEEEEITTTHSPSPFLESERESKREEERETESSFFFFSVVSIVESQIDLKGLLPSQRIPSSWVSSTSCGPLLSG